MVELSRIVVGISPNFVLKYSTVQYSIVQYYACRYVILFRFACVCTVCTYLPVEPALLVGKPVHFNFAAEGSGSSAKSAIEICASLTLMLTAARLWLLVKRYPGPSKANNVHSMKKVDVFRGFVKSTDQLPFSTFAR